MERRAGDSNPIRLATDPAGVNRVQRLAGSLSTCSTLAPFDTLLNDMTNTNNQMALEEEIGQ